jgi:hypothetical protein
MLKSGKISDYDSSKIIHVSSSDGRIYVCTDDAFYVLSNSLDIIGSQTLSQLISCTIASSMAYCLTQDGVVQHIDLKSFKIQSSVKVSDDECTGIAKSKNKNRWCVWNRKGIVSLWK